MLKCFFCKGKVEKLEEFWRCKAEGVTWDLVEKTLVLYEVRGA